MPPPLTLTAYAKRRGCSVKSVSLAIKVGRLVGCVGRDEHNRPTIVDAELADREWSVNTRQRTDVQTSARQNVPPPAGPPHDPLPAPTAAAPRGRLAELPDGVPAYNVSQAVRAQAAARRECAQADLAELELAAKRGQLVDGDAIRAAMFARISMAKTRLLGVPTLIGQDAPDIAPRVVPLIERRIRDAIEELSLDDRHA